MPIALSFLIRLADDRSVPARAGLVDLLILAAELSQPVSDEDDQRWRMLFGTGADRPERALAGSEAQVSWLFERLDREEVAKRQRLEKLQAQLETLRQQVTMSEERLARFAITRETVLALQQQGPVDEDTGQEQRRASPDAGPGSPAPRGAAGPQSGSGTSAASPERRKLTGTNEQVVVLLAGAGRAMRAKEIALAMGEPNEHGRVETMRTRLKRLVATGWLAEEHPPLHEQLPRICRQQTITIHPADLGEAAKLRQELHYLTGPWTDAYKPIRAQTVINGRLKGHSVDLGAPKNRLAHSRAAQTILAALTIMVANLELLTTWRQTRQPPGPIPDATTKPPTWSPEAKPAQRSRPPPADC